MNSKHTKTLRSVFAKPIEGNIKFSDIEALVVGLGGEVRSVPRIENRIREAIHMGFRHCLLPRRNLKGLPQELLKKIDLQGVDVVDEAIHACIR